jgi:dUTP pyrophosphatase
MIHVKVKVRRLDPDLPLPEYKTEGAAGMDLYARHDLAVMPRPQIVLTGIEIELPDGYEAKVCPRSGCRFKIWNSPGTIDSDYRGEIKVEVWSPDTANPLILRGDRIAQLVISPVARAELVEVDELSETDRGSSGHGSTGR